MSPTSSEEGAELHLATSTSPDRPGNSTSDGPALDHRYFPHIIDLIWSYLDYPAIVACAKTGRLWKEKAMDYVDHVALLEFEDGSVVLRSRSLDWTESAALMYPRSYIGNFPLLLRGFETVDIFYGTPDELKVPSSAAWPINFIRHSAYDHWPILQSSPKEIRSALFQYRSGHFFFGTPMEVVPCEINSLTLTVHCESDPTRPNLLITSLHVNSVISLFPSIEDVEIFTIILMDARDGDSSPEDLDIGGGEGCGCCDIDCPETLPLDPESMVPDFGAFCELGLLSLLMPKLRTFYLVGTELFDDVYASLYTAVLNEEAAFVGLNPLSSVVDTLSHREYEEYADERRYRLQTEW